MREMRKNNKAITLIALIITIIILLILAGVTISALADNGLFGKAKISKMRSDYASAKEIIDIKLMEVQADCIGDGREYTIVEIAKSIKEDKEITIERYYNENTSLIKTGITENLVSLKGIVVSVNRYSEYKFLIGKSCEIEGITIEEITDTFEPEDFPNPEEFEEDILGNGPSNDNGNNDDIVEEPKEEEKDVPEIGEDVDTTNPIEITTYMAIKSNSKNTLNLTGVENATYTVQEKTSNVSLSGNILTANNNADSKDSCKIQITGTYNGQSYTNNLTVYVEPKYMTTVEDEDGNVLDAFAIYTAQDLVRIQELVNSKVNDTFNAKMMNDINLSTVCGENIGTWIPVGYFTSDTEYTAFRGIFDGQNFTINNLYINITSESDIVYSTAFIGNIEGGVLKNLKFNNPYIYSEMDDTAVAVGYLYNNSLIENVKILNGTIESTNMYTGGICGFSETNSIIRNCYNNSTITSQGNRTGGICGSSKTSIIKNCYNSSAISSQGINIAGICGANIEATIENCYNTGIISSTGEDSNSSANTGGIVGVNYNNSTVKNCYNTGDVTASYLYVGGIVGYNGGTGTQTVENVFNTGTITRGTFTATEFIGETSHYAGTLIGRYGPLTGNYNSISKEKMAKWDSATILQNLGESFKLNTNSNLNDGLPILSWQ